MVLLNPLISALAFAKSVGWVPFELKLTNVNCAFQIGSFPLNLTYFNLTVYNSPWSRVSSKCLVHSRCGHCEKEDKKVLPVKQECDYSFPTSLAVSLAVLAVLLLVNIILIVLLCRMCHRQANKEKSKYDAKIIRLNSQDANMVTTVSICLCL